MASRSGGICCADVNCSVTSYNYEGLSLFIDFRKKNTGIINVWSRCCTHGRPSVSYRLSLHGQPCAHGRPCIRPHGGLLKHVWEWDTWRFRVGLYQLETMAQCISARTWNHITTPIHYMCISDTIWVQCIPMRTQNCIKTLIDFLCTLHTV